MNEIGWDLDPRYIPNKFDHDRRGIAPRRVVTGLAGKKIINYLIKHSFNEPHLPWTNLAGILTQGTSLPSLTKIEEDLHPGER